MTKPNPSVAAKAVITVNKVESKLNSQPVHVVLILLTGLIFSALLVFNYLSANPDISGGLFTYSQAEIAKMYPVRITPAGWAFSIWGLIYFAMASWVLYNLALLCRVSPNGSPAYLDPSVLNPTFLIFFNLSSLSNIGWLFMWDKFLFLSALIFLVCITISLYLTWAIASYRISIFKNYLIDQGRKLEARFINVAVVNGLATYAAWSTIATLVNLNVALVYKMGREVAPETGSIISLAVLAAVILIYVPLDLSLLDRYTRYTFAPYLVVVWASAAIICENWNPENISSIMAGVILGASALSALSKITIAYGRARNEMYQYRQMKAGNE